MKRLLSVGASVALATTALTVTGGVEGASGAAEPTRDKKLWREAKAYYSTQRDSTVAEDESPESLADARAAAKLQAGRARPSTGFPPAARELARREAAADSGVSPRASLRSAGAEPVVEARLLTILVQFNPRANDDFSGWERPISGSDDSGACETEPEGTLISGPLHNRLPDPATIGSGRDDFNFWVPNFSESHYRKLIFSREGLTEPARPDLGGIDLSGVTMRNHYEEMSRGRYALTGDVTPWLTLPHSEAWYSADSCAGGRASDVGHPDNPRGTGQMVIDGVQALHDADPDYPFSDYDVEDQGDLDGDGDLFEPDGVIDHVILIHAGADQAGGGGVQESYAEWSSSQTVDPSTGGFEVPGTGVKVFNYTTQPEDAGVGVLSHEYGHDLGLPDLYDSIGPTDSDVDFWDLMASGSNTGPLVGTIPTNMGAWSKYVLGWIEPEVMDFGSAKRRVVLGQAADVPRNSESAAKIELPDKVTTFGAPHSGELAWWSGNDQDDADVRLSRTMDVPDGADVRFWMWNDYTIEEFWDYGFVEVSTDDGASWTQLEVFDETGTMVSTDEDPNGNLANYYGGLENGLTGDSGGYRHDYVDLTPYAGSTVQLRLRYATDAAFVERGWLSDDFELVADGTVVFSDDVENGDAGWTPEVSTWTSSTGAGWVRSNGVNVTDQYYLVEWRTPVGFDRGLLYAYNTRFIVGDEWNHERQRYNVPGMLIWYRDASNSFNDINNNLFDPPSIGSKGQTLLVDSHFWPRRLKGRAAELNPSLLDNLNSRPQSADAAFGPNGGYRFRFCFPADLEQDTYDWACNRFGARRKDRVVFNDKWTWYPGLEYRPDLDPDAPLFFTDIDASTVIPSRDNESYTTRITDGQGNLVRELFGLEVAPGHVFGTGNPVDGRPATPTDPGTDEDLSLGVFVKYLESRAGDRKALVAIRPGRS